MRIQPTNMMLPISAYDDRHCIRRTHFQMGIEKSAATMALCQNELEITKQGVTLAEVVLEAKPYNFVKDSQLLRYGTTSTTVCSLYIKSRYYVCCCLFLGMDLLALHVVRRTGVALQLRNRQLPYAFTWDGITKHVSTETERCVCFHGLLQIEY